MLFSCFEMDVKHVIAAKCKKVDNTRSWLRFVLIVMFLRLFHAYSLLITLYKNNCLACAHRPMITHYEFRSKKKEAVGTHLQVLYRLNVTIKINKIYPKFSVESTTPRLIEEFCFRQIVKEILGTLIREVTGSSLGQYTGFFYF
jgi:hypothetical protein